MGMVLCQELTRIIIDFEELMDTIYWRTFMLSAQLRDSI